MKSLGVHLKIGHGVCDNRESAAPSIEVSRPRLMQSKTYRQLFAGDRSRLVARGVHRMSYGWWERNPALKASFANFAAGPYGWATAARPKLRQVVSSKTGDR